MVVRYEGRGKSNSTFQVTAYQHAPPETLPRPAAAASLLCHLRHSQDLQHAKRFQSHLALRQWCMACTQVKDCCIELAFHCCFSCCWVFAELDSKHGLPESCLNAVHALQGHLKVVKGHPHHSQKKSAESHLQIQQKSTFAQIVEVMLKCTVPDTDTASPVGSKSASCAEFFLFRDALLALLHAAG